MADEVVRDIPEEMVEKAALEMHDQSCTCEGSARCRQSALYPPGVLMQEARAVLSAALAGRTVVELPEPDARRDSYGRVEVEWHDPQYGRRYLVMAIQHRNDETEVSHGGVVTDPDHAEARGLMLIAAAREARRLAAERASGSGVGDQP